jgi:arylsulfatase A-like enzyme
MRRVKERGLDNDTLVFFCSDNGGSGGAAHNGALSGTKWTLWEGGIRVPYIVRWPGRIPAGQILDQLAIHTDVMPTALAAAGIAAKPEWKLDGANLLPLLDNTNRAEPHSALYWRFGVQYAVRQGNWKLVKPHIDMQPRLFNLANDIGEKHDLAAKHPERVKELQALWDQWNAGNEPPRWIDNRWNGDGPRPKAKPTPKTRP